MGANLYLMDYNNQMVQTGKLTDIGYKLMENVKDSYRAGLEQKLLFHYGLIRFYLMLMQPSVAIKLKTMLLGFDHYDNQENWN